MKKIFLKGYIEYEKDNYTFNYGNGKLELINVNHSPSPLKEYKFIEWLKGFTIDGFDIYFYINKKCYFINGTYTCLPQIIFISNSPGIEFSEFKFDSLCFKGETINRFYSNRNMIKIKNKQGEKKLKAELEIKKSEDTIVSENAIINGISLDFELSNINPGWRDDGIFTFNEYDSLLRLKYKKPLCIEKLTPNIVSIQKLMQFCSNRKIINYSEVYLEAKDSSDNYSKKALIFIPPIVDNIINKNMIEYDVIKGKISKIFEFFDKSEYVLETLPADNKEYSIVDNKGFSSKVSCFQSTYETIDSGEEVDTSNTTLIDLKKELKCVFNDLDEKYKGKDKQKRKYLSRFDHIIQTSDLKIENILINEIEKHNYLLECIQYPLRDKIKEIGLDDACENAIDKRDRITHKELVEFDMADVGIYKIMNKLNHILILEYCGIEKEKTQKCIEYLSVREII